jgi:hypothetical protein
MPRQARPEALGTLHHVMVRWIEGTDLLRDDGTLLRNLLDYIENAVSVSV